MTDARERAEVALQALWGDNWDGIDDVRTYLAGYEAGAAESAARIEALECAGRMLLDRTANPITDHSFYTLSDARERMHAALAEEGAR